MTGGLSKTTSTLALAAAAGLMLGSLTLPTAARAADLGGDCCADLETRVAELEATTVRKGNKKVSLTITGRVAAAMVFWNDSGPADSIDGFQDNSQFDHLSDLSFGNVGDGPNIVFKGEGKIRPDLTAGFSMEIGNNFDAFDQANHSTGRSGGLGTDNVYVYLSSKSLGTLELGKQDSAADFFNVNYDGSWIGGFSSGRANRRFLVRDVASGEFTGNTFASYLSTLEHGGDPELRYASPLLGGFSFTGSIAGDDRWGLGANYAMSHGTVTVGLGAGFGRDTRQDAGAIDTSVDYTAFSAGIKESSSGLFLSGDWTRRSTAVTGYVADDATNFFVNGGWAKNVTGAGDTTIHVSYDRTTGLLNDALTGADSVAHTTVIGIDQKFDSAETHVYLQWEGSTIDTPVRHAGFTDAAQSISSITAGMAIKY